MNFTKIILTKNYSIKSSDKGEYPHFISGTLHNLSRHSERELTDQALQWFRENKDGIYQYITKANPSEFVFINVEIMDLQVNASDWEMTVKLFSEPYFLVDIIDKKTAAIAKYRPNIESNLSKIEIIDLQNVELHLEIKH